MEGYEAGETCNRDGCIGVIDQYESDGSCSCHTNPPCSHCTTAREYCPNCGWDARDEQLDFEKMARTSETGFFDYSKWEEARRLFEQKFRGEIESEKLEIRRESHTHFSMKVRGVFPKGTETAESLHPKVAGTFGGRFTHINDFRFEYIAYTD